MAFTIDFNFILRIVGTLLVCSFAGFTLGSVIVYFLTTNIKSKEKNAIFLSIATFALAVVVNALFWITPWQILWNSGMLLVAMLFGYFWAARGILQLDFQAQLPEGLPIKPERKNAVILLAKGESEEYMPVPLIRLYRKSAETGVSQTPMLAKPFELYKLKRKYMKIGAKRETISKDEILADIPLNPYRKLSEKILEGLVEKSAPQFDFSRGAYVNDWPFLSHALLSAISEGAENITILNLFLSECYEYELAINDMKRIDFSEIGIKIAQTDFLAGSDVIQEAVSQKIFAAIPSGQKSSEIGVLLIAEGQPEQWDELYPVSGAEIEFREGVEKRLISLGFKDEKIEYAWLYNRTPTIAQALEALVKKDCKTIIHTAATIPIDCLNSLVNIPEAISKVPLKDVELIEVDAWNDDQNIMEALLGQINNAKEIPLNEFASESAIILQATKEVPDSSEEEPLEEVKELSEEAKESSD